MTLINGVTEKFLVIAAILVFAAFGCVLGFSRQTTSNQVQSPVRLKDDSDWWSLTKGYDVGRVVKVQQRELPPGSFQILGVQLEDELLATAIGKLGPATNIERGEAGEWRSQLCYSLAGESQHAYLIFETGEIDRAFYLFKGPAWNGNDKCAATNLAAGKLATGSGLHLGQSRAEVIAILGKPSGEREGEMVYSVESRKKNSPAELKKLRKRSSQMSDQDFDKFFAVADLSAIVVLKFAESRLNYIAVSKSETY